MVGILSETVRPNARLAALGLDALPSTTSDVLWATAEEAWHFNPTPSAARLIERANQYRAAFGEEFPTEIPGISLSVPDSGATVLHPEQANARFGIPGHLTFDAWLPEATAQDLHDMKRAELRRLAVFARSQGGFGEGAARLGLGLLVSALDPTNVAAIFIPSVGPARTAIWAARMGRLPARATAGAIEGAIGTALVEPLILAAARGEQAEYDLLDSLLNLAFGSALGAGAHSGLGALGDAIERRALRLRREVPAAAETLDDIGERLATMPLHEREQALRASVAAMAEGRRVAVAETMPGRMQPGPRVPVVEADPGDVPGSILRFANEALADRTPRFLQTGDVSKALADRIASEVGLQVEGFRHVMQTHEVRHTLVRHGEGSPSLRPDELPVTPEDIARVPEIIADPQTTIRADRSPQGAPALIFTHRNGNTTIVVEEVRSGKKRLAFRSMRIKRRGDPGASDASPVREGPATIRPEPASGIDSNVGRPGIDGKAAAATARQPGAPEDRAVSDAVARQATEKDPADIDPVKALDEQTAELLAEIDAAEAAGAPVDRAALEEADTLASGADEAARAFEAAAACLGRRGG